MKIDALKLVSAALLLAASAVTVIAADKPQTRPAAAPAAASAAAPTKPAAPRGVAVLHSASGSSVTGTVSFTEAAGGVVVKVELSSLTPGKHGFHIHEFGDCSAPDATSAGGHFNPMAHPHAGMDTAMRHAGDLGNIEAGPDGKAMISFIDKGLELTGANSIAGRGVIVHANADDFTTQPTGNAGGRVACGVIGWAR